MAVEAHIALGGNLGEVLKTFRAALGQLSRQSGIELVAVAPAYRTAALMPPGVTGRYPDYWNSVATLRTHLSAAGLLASLLAVEVGLGRRRCGRWRPRTLDLDLLLYGASRIEEPGLSIPHPGLNQRPFVLRPLCDIAPTARLPDGTTALCLLRRLADPNAGILERRRDWHQNRVLLSAGVAALTEKGPRAALV